MYDSFNTTGRVGEWSLMQFSSFALCVCVWFLFFWFFWGFFSFLFLFVLICLEFEFLKLSVMYKRGETGVCGERRRI